jgi:hypothetical protein
MSGSPDLDNDSVLARQLQEKAAELARSESPVAVDTATLIEALAYNLRRQLGEDARPLLVTNAGASTDG